jgi:hypothetical protein
LRQEKERGGKAQPIATVGASLENCSVFWSRDDPVTSQTMASPSDP